MCRIEVEMSPLGEVEMSSFGSFSPGSDRSSGPGVEMLGRRCGGCQRDPRKAQPGERDTFPWQKRSRMQAGTNTGQAKASSTATAPASCIATMASQWARIDDSERRTYSSGSWSRSHSARANCILAGMYVDPRTPGHLPVHDEAPPLQLAEVLPSRPVGDEHARSRKSRRSVCCAQKHRGGDGRADARVQCATKSGPTGVRGHPSAHSARGAWPAARRPDPLPARSYPPRFGFVLRMISLKPQQVARF